MPTAREDTVRLADLLRREHHALAEFLIALANFDRERRWVDLGHRSLFDFLTRELGLSAGAAYYRKTAAELIQRFPEVVEPLRDGRLCFTSVVELSKNLTPENRDAILPRFFHVSKREAKAITAELQPVPNAPMRTVITAVPEPQRAPGARPPVVDAFHPDETRPAEVEASLARPPPARPPRERAEIEPLTPDLRRMHLTVSRELLEALAVARDAVSHSHPDASDEAIIKLGLDLVIERHRKRRGIGCKPRRGAAGAEASSVTAEKSEAKPPPPPPPRRKRAHVPAAVSRAVWERDGGRCAWPLENDGVCGSTSQVELDHIEGFALGAGTTVAECRLLCRFHQDVSARQLYGDDVMNRFTTPKRGPRCSEPVVAYAPTALGAGLAEFVPRAPTRPATFLDPDARYARARSRKRIGLLAEVLRELAGDELPEPLAAVRRPGNSGASSARTLRAQAANAPGDSLHVIRFSIDAPRSGSYPGTPASTRSALSCPGRA